MTLSENRLAPPPAKLSIRSWVGTVLVAAALLSCSPRLETRDRFHFWAKYVSREARKATGGAV